MPNMPNKFVPTPPPGYITNNIQTAPKQTPIEELAARLYAIEIHLGLKRN